MLYVEPLRPNASKALARKLLAEGEFAVSRHARQEMDKDNMQNADVVNLLRAGVYRDGEWENGEWRYHVETQRMTLIIAFRAEFTRIAVVTAWRTRP